MQLSKENKLSIYLYLILIVNQSGVRLPFLNYMTGNNQIVLAVLLLLVGFLFFRKEGRLHYHWLGMRLFWWLLTALVLSIFMAYYEWQQDYSTSILLYRHHIWLLFLPLFLYVKPSVKSISDALFAFTITSGLVWVGQVIGILPVTVHETITGVIMDGTDEFGGHGVVGVRIVTFSLYLFLWEVSLKLSKINILKVLIAIIVVVLSTQRAMLLFALLLTAYVFIFKIKKVSISLLFTISALLFFINTQEIWLGFIDETTAQMGDKDYNRWKAIDYFLNHYSKGFMPKYLGNGFLSLKNSGGVLLYNLGYDGIFIDDIGMLGVWVRYGLIPLLIVYYVVIKIFMSKSSPLYMRLMGLHIALLPTSWTLIGPHYFVLLFLIYLYCLNRNIANIEPEPADMRRSSAWCPNMRVRHPYPWFWQWR